MEDAAAAATASAVCNVLLIGAKYQCCFMTDFDSKSSRDKFTKRLQLRKMPSNSLANGGERPSVDA